VIGVVLIADGFDHHVREGLTRLLCDGLLGLRGNAQPAHAAKRAVRPVELHEDRYTR